MNIDRDSENPEPEIGRPNKLTHVNITREMYREDQTHNWRFDLHSTDETCWTVENGLTETEAIERAKTFNHFSGLPVYRFGQSIE